MKNWSLAVLLIICPGNYQFRDVAGYVRWMPARTFVVKSSCTGHSQAKIRAPRFHVPLKLKVGGKN